VSGHDADWHRRRLSVVGGSEVAALFGCQQPYQLSHYALWNVKAGLIAPPEMSAERIDWGNDLETAIAEVVARRKGWPIRKGGHMVDVTTPGLGATLDFVIETVENFGALEIKNVDAVEWKRKWLDNEPPIHILLQLQHQLAASNMTWGAVGALVGGNRLEIYEYEARPAIIAEIRARVTAFWKSIDEGKPPPIDGSDSSFYALKELNPTISNTSINLTGDNEFPELCAELLALTEQRKKLEKEEALAKARIMEKLGAARSAWTDGFSAKYIEVADDPGRLVTLPMVGQHIGGRKGYRRLDVKETGAK
jgi:predicted phage-related endonuclease